jgi:hypothetical protein
VQQLNLAVSSFRQLTPCSPQVLLYFRNVFFQRRTGNSLRQTGLTDVQLKGHDPGLSPIYPLSLISTWSFSFPIAGI